VPPPRLRGGDEADRGSNDHDADGEALNHAAAPFEKRFKPQ
jgi:hypothetical protein